MFEDDFILIPEELTIKEPDEKLLALINEKTFNDNVLFEIQSDFHDIKVTENEIGRFLHYGDTYQAGFIDTDFYKGNLPYINYFLICALINPDIQNILLIGAGSCKIIKDFETVFQNLKKIDVVDLEEHIFEIAENFFGFKKSKKCNFFLQDGITYLRTTKKKYDLIVVDVANNDGIDLRFLSEDYFDSLKKTLSDNGIFVSNMCASPDFHHPDNIFFNEFFPMYKKYFNHNLVFKGDYSDKVYYKSFFDIDERVIDITNVIIFSSDRYDKFSSKNKNLLEKTGMEPDKYLKDFVDI